MTLRKYEQKRRFGKTPEPKPGRQGKAGKFPAFVIQKHAARRLHYDLRLEMDGVLKSWAVPKEPTLDPSVKRLAVQVEDHPLAYQKFEGTIPAGNYGAGRVEIWDRGNYSPLSGSLRQGHLKFVLDGRKLKGGFALVKTHLAPNSWLLIKEKDRYAAAAAGKNRPDPLPHNVSPMLAMAAAKPFNDDNWLFEIKWDGYRALAETGQTVRLYSRNQRSLAARFPEVAAALKKLRFNAVLDGEIVVLDRGGKPDFQQLQNSRGRAVYCVFDILYYQGRDLTGWELAKRKDLLESILPKDRHIKYTGQVKGDGVSFFRAAQKQGLEGIMAKDARSHYLPGVRSRSWLKLKSRVTQDCVIAGFTGPRGSRQYFGSLVLGAYSGKKLVYVGHSGGGFGGLDLKKVYDRLRPLVSKTSPFKAKLGETGQITWVKPQLVCEVAFTEWTREGLMRQPIFLRFRDDKAPAEALIERPVR